MSKQAVFVTDFLHYSAMTVLMLALLKGSSQRSPISEVAQSYSNIIRVAMGESALTDEQRAFEQFQRDYEADPDNLPRQEHRLNLALGLEREPEHNAAYYARGLVGAMHGRKKSLHRGGPDHDPIWRETQ